MPEDDLDAVRMGQLYPIGEGEPAPQHSRARWTGETRCPRKGEWYLSGAIVEAWQARANMSRPYCIASLVRGRMVWQEEG